MVSNASPFIRKLFQDRPDYLRQIIDFDGDSAPEFEKLKNDIFCHHHTLSHQAKKYDSEGEWTVLYSRKVLIDSIRLSEFKPFIDDLHMHNYRFYAYWKEERHIEPETDRTFRLRDLVIVGFESTPSEKRGR